jgi:hypothetical protein
MEEMCVIKGHLVMTTSTKFGDTTEGEWISGFQMGYFFIRSQSPALN